MNDLITVIVPVYNVINCLERCVNSILSQTYKNLEIILVDDGSTDGSAALCDRFKEREPRIQVIHKKNGGLSSARNMGITLAEGSYIAFIDSDDWIKDDMIEKLYHACRRYSVNIACCGRYKVYESGKAQEVNTLNECTVWSGTEALKRLLTWNKVDSSVCDKLWKRELFCKDSFPINRLHEDIPITYLKLWKEERIAHVGLPLYYYWQRDKSISRNLFSKGNMDLFYYSLKINKDIKTHYSELKNEADFFTFKNILYLMLLFDTKCKRQYKADYHKLRKYFNKTYRFALISRYTSPYEKVKIIIAKLQLEPVFLFLKSQKTIF